MNTTWNDIKKEHNEMMKIKILYINCDSKRQKAEKYTLN